MDFQRVQHHSSSIQVPSSKIQVPFKFLSSSIQTRCVSVSPGPPRPSVPFRRPGGRSVGPRLVRGLKAAYKPSKVCRAHSRPSPARLSPSRPWPSGPLLGPCSGRLAPLAGGEVARQSRAPLGASRPPLGPLRRGGNRPVRAFCPAGPRTLSRCFGPSRIEPGGLWPSYDGPVRSGAEKKCLTLHTECDIILVKSRCTEENT